ncbi:MAG TPA: chemotaxis protein CheW [Bryobacteraceae bacterium]|nr:chemotaxis protein CheW [Bryobacteraceae bacterium]
MSTTLTTSSAEMAVTKADERAGKYLTFHLGTEEFGIRVMQVREIIGIQDITRVPQTPGYVKGVINLRGKVTPVICLRQKFGMPEVEYTQRTCIIVVQIASEAGPVILGAVVDGVSEVVTLSAADIENTPDFGSTVDTPYILGMAKSKGRVRILLDIDSALSAHDLRGLEGLAKSL